MPQVIGRQADAAADAALLIQLKSKAAALRFRGQQDALDFIRHGFEDVDRLLASQNIHAVDRYVKGDVGVYAKIRSLFSGHQCDLIFFRVPSNSSPARADDVAGASLACGLAAEENRGVGDDEGFEGAMFLGISNLIESPEGAIPSFVSIAPCKNRADFRRQIFTPSVEVVPEIILGGSEREFDSLEGGAFCRHSGGVPGLVQGGPHVVRGVEQNAWEHVRQIAVELDLKKIATGIRISINEFGPWLAIDEFVHKSIEVTDVMLCANQRQSSTVKQISHGQIRSDKRPGIPAGA